ncbi:DUF7500 family protein [Halosegnis marinus]|uniref:Uncharacterized protein n=1 Tax=Halosegnis marinus TaxID=3034023 RepID=A0ABD5ZQL1_9EURY|nr:hypothetical protein [Halosegnis sp. DT85]
MTTDDPPEGVLSPDDLDSTDDRLRELDGDRYVVTTDGDDDDVDPTDTEPSPPPDADDGSMEQTLPAPDGAYGVVGRGRIDGDEVAVAVESNDVAETFESLVRWYAGAVAPDVPPEEAVAVLLDNADIAVDAEVSR